MIMNRLKKESSPYLLQHAENPVDWYPWGNEAFEEAAKADKPIFLSIGYSTCHWCHVMAKESFEDEEIAEILNKYFVCIKVDREERPDVDSIYMSVCQAFTGSGGWPLTVIMTPEQKPFFAGTYFPKHSSRGMPGLTELLLEAAELWNTDRDALTQTGIQITDLIQKSEDIHAHSLPTKRLLNKSYTMFKRSFDSVWGGFGIAPKFPTPHNLIFLMRYAQYENAPDAMQMAVTTLKAMAAGGMFDHIGGGFSRYSTDRKWLVPHFEKMLYDNALLTMAYLEAYQRTGDKAFCNIAQSTLEYVKSELTDPKGGFYCGQDADSDGVEGKYYTFTRNEILEVLGEKDGEEFCDLYNINTDESVYSEHKSIPNLIGSKTSGWKYDDKRIVTLQNYRKERTSLHTDDKIILSWNAWMIAALATAERIFRDGKNIKIAETACKFIEKNLADSENRLLRRYRKGNSALPGTLEDYAAYSLALLELYKTTFNAEYLKLANLRAGQMIRFFEDTENGGYFLNASYAEQLITRPKEMFDGAMPSGNSTAEMVLEELASLTGEKIWKDASDRQHRFMASFSETHPMSSSFSLLSVAKYVYPHGQLICCAKHLPSDLLSYLQATPASNISILFKSEKDSETLAECAPYTAAYSIPDSGAMWYLCENNVCKRPVRSFKELNL